MNSESHGRFYIVYVHCNENVDTLVVFNGLIIEKTLMLQKRRMLTQQKNHLTD